MSATQDTPSAGAPRHGTPTARAPADTPPPTSYLAGDIIAQKYRLTRLLGEGGMGAVWLAHNEKLDVDVAIKLIRRELATPDTAQRLLQEARAAARIGHRSIVRVFDFGETELDDPFIVMELLSGESLRDVLDRKGRIPATNAVRILLPIASALVEAHGSGIVHRDLKPENVMLVPDNAGGMVPKLLDFGIAKLRRSDGARDEVSGAGLVAGTPAYMSPEQAGGREEVDEGADVWALGVMLYEALTGELPFDGQSYAALVFAVMTAEPVPIMDKMAGDARLWEILKAALAKLASGRPSMRAFGMALAEWAIAQGIDSDVAGTSLAAHWTQAPQNPLSAPPAADVDLRASDVAIPRPPALPGEGRPTAPPPEPTRASSTKRAGALAVGGLVAVALLIVAVSSRSSSRPPPTPKPVASVASVAPPAPPATVSAQPPATPAPEASASAAASAEAPEASATAATSARPVFRSGKPPRKSSLPIAKQPNF